VKVLGACMSYVYVHTYILKEGRVVYKFIMVSENEIRDGNINGRGRDRSQVTGWINGSLFSWDSKSNSL
jgi:hypothetical protein